MFHINHYARQVPKCVHSRCNSPGGHNALVRGVPPSMRIHQLYRILESNAGNPRGRQSRENLAADAAGDSDERVRFMQDHPTGGGRMESMGVKAALLAMLHLAAGAAFCQLPDEATACVFQHPPCTLNCRLTCPINNCGMRRQFSMSCPSPKHHPLQFDLAFIVVPTFVDCSHNIEHCCIKSRKGRIVLGEAAPGRGTLWTSSIDSIAVADESGPASKLTELCVWEKAHGVSKLPDVRTDDADPQLQEVPPPCRASAAERLVTQEHPCLTRDAFETGDNTPSNSSRYFSNAVLSVRSHDPDSPAESIRSVSRQRVIAKDSGVPSGFPRSPSR
jgi:hypothetical protein